MANHDDHFLSQGGDGGKSPPVRGGILPAVVDVLAHVMMKDGAASDMFGNMQSPVIRTEEQF